ncbi:hypothetical protein [Hymenobacter sp. BRD67]|uniref:hypothetical protein n=1 Tax=Hymenobacter sp. BRD67 TaxID=2675877 RepID=UPI001563ACD8|nr:hypothetical protein [Hymenobacter sp. BRD67]QKG53946.1 hypothetical protein GKZ67_16740 [Hymenobacter sp. BRD67]
MNTLKLKLLAASLFVFAAAHAQQATPYSLGAVPGANAGASGYQGRSTSFANDSYVLQNGTSQYANVNQTGPGNTADIVQDLDNDNEGHNNAYQTQDRTGSTSGARNRAWIGQDGNYSTAIQIQHGSGNTANSDQGPNDADFNYSYQSQAGNGDRAGVTQTSNGNVAVQMQYGGDNNYATTAQSGGANWSWANQNGSSNTSIVVQH